MSYSNLTVGVTLLGLIGLHPERGRLQHIWVFVIICTNWTIIYLETMLMLSKDVIGFQDYINTFSSMSSTLHGLVATSALYIKRAEVQDLYVQMERHFWKLEDFTLNSEQKAYFDQSVKEMTLNFHMICTFCIVTYIIFFCQTFLTNEKEMLLFPCYRPEWISYYPLLIYQLVAASFNQIIPSLLTDDFMLSFTTLTQLQFKLLNIEIERVFSKNGVLPRKSIKGLIDHHNFLLDYNRRLNNAFSGFNLLYIAIIIFSLCFEMYNVVAETSLGVFAKSLCYIFAILFEFMTLFCLPAQKLTDEAEKVVQHIFSSNWPDHTEAKTAVILMNKVGQLKVAISAGGVININLETGLATVKTMVSYAMFLRTMSIKN